MCSGGKRCECDTMHTKHVCRLCPAAGNVPKTNFMDFNIMCRDTDCLRFNVYVLLRMLSFLTMFLFCKRTEHVFNLYRGGLVYSKPTHKSMTHKNILVFLDQAHRQCNLKIKNRKHYSIGQAMQPTTSSTHLRHTTQVRHLGAKTRKSCPLLDDDHLMRTMHLLCSVDLNESIQLN